ncbi:protein translocase subunit SecD [Homoserinibacter sp. YIM 151385]|uniref:protein translocase subunit SecD n=1 Tax=Homoserinibacter sp. YIM 151385 TaxID=2985506 RepID=UPI0022F0EE0E|nr:protein translocase subunit SecD [Homoserinibacter sp. YIM 151385]WBU38678.1 protein translocase subunit SecD [Homoserinibacter sp. YIM 151385]
MATRTTPVRKAWRALTWLLVIIVALTGLQTAGVLFWKWDWTPKLALDLEGGTQIILAPQLESGQQVTQDQLTQAVAIIRDRVDAAGVSESEISTQGNENIVVAMPGTIDDATRDRIQASAKLEFRPVLLADVPSGDSMADPSASPSPSGDAEEADPAPSASLESTPSVSPTDGSDTNWITPALQQQFDDFDCADVEDSGANVAPAAEPLVTCEADGSVKYLLGPTEVAGSTISDATNGIRTNQQGVSTGQWAVNIVFDDEGTKQFADVTTRLNALEGVRNQFAIVLDGAVISAPTTNAVITNGKPEISGNFTQESSKVLADQLKFGALPIGFQVQSEDTISATLGTSQLQSGLIAGLIGMILVIIYSLFQYRMLGLVTVASLLVAGIITYLVISILSWREGYRLSLAGVAGLIVAIGFTADSFIVYFERIRDELRDGRGLVGAVEAGWKRALRTIYAAKGVNMLSAIVLFIVAVGSVRGFALTLGITVIIDIIIVVLFTHPVLQLLATTRFFSSGHPASGLDPNALGAVYRGRAQFRTSVEERRQGASREAQRRQTIAERKAAGTSPQGDADDAGTGRKDS